jgi:hypothetical protein
MTGTTMTSTNSTYLPQGSYMQPNNVNATTLPGASPTPGSTQLPSATSVQAPGVMNTLIVQQPPQQVYSLSTAPQVTPSPSGLVPGGTHDSSGNLSQQQAKPPILTMSAPQQTPQSGSYMVIQQPYQQQPQQMMMMPPQQQQQYQQQQQQQPQMMVPSGYPNSTNGPIIMQPYPNQVMMQNQHMQQQQPINQLPDTGSSNTTPTKKLTKKQLRELQQSSGEGVENGETTPGKTAKPRKLKPKSQKISALPAGGDEEEENETGEGNEDSSSKAGETLSASTHANIEATIDDLMKQYITDSPPGDDNSGSEKKKKKAGKKLTKKKKKKADGDEDADADDQDNEDEKDESFNIAEVEGTRKTARRSVKKNLRLQEADSNDEFEVQANEIDVDKTKKRKFGKKKSDLNETGGEAGAEVGTTSVDEAPKPILAPKPELGERFKAVMSMPTMPSNRGRRKSTQSLMKMMKKKNKKKKNQKGSSGEDDDEDDDSDDFELTNATAISMNKGGSKPKDAAETNGEAAEAAEGENDEETAKTLQANENKRRSGRAVSNKKLKYGENECTIRDEDLLIPVDPNAPEEEEAAPNDSNIQLQTQENLIVDKILGKLNFFQFQSITNYKFI